MGETLDKEERFVRVCVKLDELRFENNKSWKIGEDIFNKNLPATQRIFLTWLCSIIDRPPDPRLDNPKCLSNLKEYNFDYRAIWTVGEKAMLMLIRNNPRSFFDVCKTICSFKMDKCGNIFIPVKINGEDREFVLLTECYSIIRNTCEFLSRYDTSDCDLSFKFVKLLGDAIDAFKGKDGILKLANFLDKALWKNNYQGAMKRLIKRRYREKPQKKRLWMFIMMLRRDPAILEVFKDALVEVYGEEKGKELHYIWTDNDYYNPSEIELPGDRWNVRVFKMMRLVDENVKEGDIEKIRRIARELAQQHEIFPSVFDVTFEIGANFCRKGRCNECPFGENLLCKQNRGPGKECVFVSKDAPYDSRLFPYYVKDSPIMCDPEKCPIGRDLGEHLCNRECVGSKSSKSKG